MLVDLLQDEHIIRNVHVPNWEAAIRCSGELLVKTECVEPQYVDQMIAISKEAGPYIVIVPGVALAHARPTDGVNHLGLSLATLNEPVAFGNADNDPVRVVISLAALDSSGHLNALRDLVRFVSVPQNIDNLCQCKSNEEVRELIRQFEDAAANR